MPSSPGKFFRRRVLAALQVIEWPLALVITAGHLLADQHLSGLAKGTGEALESA